ncbi:TPA: two-component sensor histidine kinase [Legionella pneumophila]|nr:ATP-binding protein [Legionella pneumophila subsp. fraseri]HAT1771310.1 two-component sensor histidine kinase [Legionella pneumophila]MDX1845336.1 ATP-binding protein [Legionella pneumophila subsp. fraseri]HAT2126278.1 two-component sensor histidine kinase [Legionella pneumophila]HAT2135218.1 two-component sensor histidine kinase [Legionella pneumophila]
MYWRFAKSMSITNRLLLIFIGSTVLILSIITGLIYPPMKELLHHTHLNNEHYNYLLTRICIKNFFVGLWFSTLIIILASYLLAKKSMRPIKIFTKELASINASSLEKRLPYTGNPKELEELASTCNDMLLRIESAFSHIKQFSASIAHELRNPIHYLRTATEITLTKPQTIETYQHVLQTHLEEYQSLTQLIDNLLFLTRCEHGQLQLNVRTLSANHLISSIIEYYYSIAQEKGIEIQIFGEAQIEVDEHLFKRVISNLIDNSLTYTNQGGRILIIIEKRTDDSIQIRIKDNGIGISKEHLPLLYHGFYRVDYSTNKENAGLGLGLAIAKSIMEHHKGQLAVDSKIGLGTTVILTLP